MWYWDFYVTFVLLKVNQPAAEFSVPQKQIGRPLSSHSFFFPLKNKKRWCDSNLCVVSGLDESGLNGQDKSKRSAAHVIGKSFFFYLSHALWLLQTAHLLTSDLSFGRANWENRTPYDFKMGFEDESGIHLRSSGLSHCRWCSAGQWDRILPHLLTGWVDL